MSRGIALLLVMTLAGTTAYAQETGQQPFPQSEEGEAILNENVEESGVKKQPNPQGLRSPEAVDEEEEADLYSLLNEVRRAPPGLDGEAVPRPNLYASEPEAEMDPDTPRDAFLFPDDFIE